MSLRKATKEDPRGVIAEAYRINDIDAPMAREILLGWALSDAGEDARAAMKTLFLRYHEAYPYHPMTELLHQGAERDGILKPSRRRADRAKAK